MTRPMLIDLARDTPDALAPVTGTVALAPTRRRAWAVLKGLPAPVAALHWPTGQPLLIPADNLTEAPR